MSSRIALHLAFWGSNPFYASRGQADSDSEQSSGEKSGAQFQGSPSRLQLLALGSRNYWVLVGGHCERELATVEGKKRGTKQQEHIRPLSRNQRLRRSDVFFWHVLEDPVCSAGKLPWAHGNAFP